MRSSSILLALLAALAGTIVPSAPAQQSHNFAVTGDHFTLDGKPFQVLSGEMHYERIPHEYWRNRLRMAKAMGLNTVSTYVFWNIHEPQPGQWNFSGDADLQEFLREAQQEGLYVVLRAGPYSCAEWEFGGFPGWLMADPKMQTALRSNDPAFMVPAERWLMRLGQEAAPYQIGRGGPVIAVQVENEYGDFGADQVYLKHMREIFVKAGFTDALLFTTNPTKGEKNGSIDGTYAAVNFGVGRAGAALDFLAQFRPGQPLFAAEYWPGWFDHWGKPHETRPIAPQLGDLETILKRGASLNLYMLHGGTSFGFMGGASWTDNNYLPDVTSYDYDAPLDEAGHTTPKYDAYRKLFAKYLGHTLPDVPTAPPVIAVPEFTLTQSASLWQNLPAPVQSDQPKSMEFYGQSTGFILYRTQLHGAVHGTLLIPAVNDYARIYLNGTFAGSIDRRLKQESLAIANTASETTLDVLIENSGRINSTRTMRNEFKGAPQGIALDGKPLAGWQVYTLPMTDPAAVAFHPIDASSSEGPHFYSGSFQLDKTGDTFVDVRGLKKGVLWINGHAIGRYWQIGPQQTLFVPGPWLKAGANQVVVFDLEGVERPRLTGLTAPILNGPVRETDDAQPAPAK
jgi:beta-galactosidase